MQAFESAAIARGQSTIIEDIDSDRWSLFEAYEELRQFGYLQSNIVALWYKDPNFDDLETCLKMLKGDAEAIEMCNIAGLRGLVELYVVHDVGDAEPFPEVGYVDVGGVAEEGRDDGLGLVVFEGHGAEAAGASAEPNEATKDGDVGDEFGVDRSESNDEDSEDLEYMPSDEQGDSAGEVHFTDSDEDFEGDSGYDDGNSVPEEATGGKENGKGINQFSDENGADSDELEMEYMIGPTCISTSCQESKESPATTHSNTATTQSNKPVTRPKKLAARPTDNSTQPKIQTKNVAGPALPQSNPKAPSSQPLPQKSSAAASSTCKNDSHSQPIQRKRHFSVIQTGAPHIPMQKLKLMLKLPPIAWSNI
ncbi:hypothetical protein Ahy_A03g016255 [Arachis hypogaea]|uniref:PB1-like domain-containing protein n=1 Tax=Arachis hypogaea TaxID=3818 RepID=A0A445E2N1_ARAHY|nr:hypothetical protein Ahy_A03g016255 [Arachis hypogaea]